MGRLIVAYGTRPEQIKLEPLVNELRTRNHRVHEFHSGQHQTAASAMHSLNWQGKTLSEGIANTMRSFESYLGAADKVDAVIVQGDTATAFACALVAHLNGVPVAHVEAGLRTYASEPFPEESFRRAIATFAHWHFCPDDDAAHNIAREQAASREGVFVVGNTVIDTLPQVPFRVIATLHRRENWGERIKRALGQLERFARNARVQVAAIRHPNWARQGINEADYPSIEFVDPLQRDDLIERMRESDVVVTDSGGLQEEAAHFGLPCLVVRTATERTALCRAGAIQLVDPDAPVALEVALDRELAKRRCYGDGDASVRIADILTREIARDVSDTV